jgi:hypothetical protein
VITGLAVIVGLGDGDSDSIGAVGEGVTPRVAPGAGVALGATSRVNVALGNDTAVGAGSAVTSS